MKTFIIRISSNEDSVRSVKQTIQSAKDVGYKEPIEIFEAIKPNEWKSILPYENTFHNYARPDNVGACFASHYLLWKECIKLNEPILILEHDAIFKTNIPDIDFNMCVNFGRPSYIRPHHMIYEEPKDGKPKGIHYTEGGPWFKEYRNCEYHQNWKNALNSMMDINSIK